MKKEVISLPRHLAGSLVLDNESGATLAPDFLFTNFSNAMKKLLLVLVAFVSTSLAFSQEALTFVHLSDTHVGSSTGAEDLRRTVKDINENAAIQFVVITGDITEFGADEEIKLVKQILDSLNKPWHIIPGNHDGNWSESGANTFKQIFHNETFYFSAGKYAFLGTHCGPNMRMGPGQIPRENIVWLDSVLSTIPDKTPLIFVNHYPQDSALNNWYEALDRLKQKNIQLILCGHGHQNHQLNFEGIPAVMGRSNLRAKADTGGYNIVTIKDDHITYEEKTPGGKLKPAWVNLQLHDRVIKTETIRYPRPSYAVNDSFPQIKEKWLYQDQSDIGSGTAIAGDIVAVTNTNGEIVALNKKSGKAVWRFKTGGKIYSIPAISDGVVVSGSSDGNIYGISLEKGRKIWSLKTGKAVLGNPVISNKIVYSGSSDGSFRAIQVRDGKLLWSFNEVKGFVVTKPLIYGGKIYFGCWNNDFYCLDINTGSLIWKWNNGSGNRMFSPAACFPVAAHNRVFIVAPDRYMTVLDANNGTVIWRKQDLSIRVRESMGLSKDSNLVFVKTMGGDVLGISTTANEMQTAWKGDVGLGYEICPTAIAELDGTVYVPTQSGTIVALDRQTGNLLWKHKVSNCLVTNIMPVSNKAVVLTTMDGKVAWLENNNK